MESGYVPRDFRPNAYDKFRDRCKLLIRIILARHYKGGNLNPYPKPLHQPYRIKDRLKMAAANLIIKIFAKGLQVYIGCVQIRPYCLHRILCYVSIGYKVIIEALFFRQSCEDR